MDIVLHSAQLLRPLKSGQLTPGANSWRSAKENIASYPD